MGTRTTKTRKRPYKLISYGVLSKLTRSTLPVFSLCGKETCQHVSSTLVTQPLTNDVRNLLNQFIAMNLRANVGNKEADEPDLVVHSRKVLTALCAGTAHYTTDVIDQPHYFNFLSCHNELADLTPTQYRASLRRVLMDTPGYRGTEFSTDLKDLLQIRIEQLGRKRWPFQLCQHKVNIEKTVASDTNVETNSKDKDSNHTDTKLLFSQIPSLLPSVRLKSDDFRALPRFPAAIVQELNSNKLENSAANQPTETIQKLHGATILIESGPGETGGTNYYQHDGDNCVTQLSSEFPDFQLTKNSSPCTSNTNPTTCTPLMKCLQLGQAKSLESHSELNPHISTTNTISTTTNVNNNPMSKFKNSTRRESCRANSSLPTSVSRQIVTNVGRQQSNKVSTYSKFIDSHGWTIPHPKNVVVAQPLQQEYGQFRNNGKTARKERVTSEVSFESPNVIFTNTDGYVHHCDTSKPALPAELYGKKHYRLPDTHDVYEPASVHWSDWVAGVRQAERRGELSTVNESSVVPSQVRQLHSRSFQPDELLMIPDVAHTTHLPRSAYGNVDYYCPQDYDEYYPTFGTDRIAQQHRILLDNTNQLLADDGEFTEFEQQQNAHEETTHRGLQAHENETRQRENKGGLYSTEAV